MLARKKTLAGVALHILGPEGPTVMPVTPSRSGNVNSVPSSSHDQAVAISGTIVETGLRDVLVVDDEVVKHLQHRALGEYRAEMTQKLLNGASGGRQDLQCDRANMTGHH
jgi:hypothetical protein